MSTAQNVAPPKLELRPDGGIEPNSFGDLLEWFLSFDERVAQIRGAFAEELFQWKQQDDKVNGTLSYPFERAEDRFAVGVFQAVTQNNSETKLQSWITDVLVALQEAKEMNEEISQSYKLGSRFQVSVVALANGIPALAERRVYLNTAWVDALCTAEARFLGWVYQELYGQPFQPSPPEEVPAETG